MRELIIKTGIVLASLSCLLGMLASPAAAQDADGGPDDNGQTAAPRDVRDNTRDPSSLLQDIQDRRTQHDSVFPASPLGGLRERSGKAKKRLYDATGLQLGFAMSHVLQAASESLPNKDWRGAASTADLVAEWDLLKRGEATRGRILAHGQGRWDYGTTGPETIGFESVGSGIGTADTFAEYSPTFLLRNLYWRQGTREAGWFYQVGKQTPDGVVSSSEHLASETTFLPSGGTAAFAIALPDSGIGAAGVWFFNDRLALGGIVADANADRFDAGDVGEGDFFTAVELWGQIAPRTAKAGYSKLTIWHTDGTQDGNAANAQTGPSGWGYFLKLEQELTADGRAIGILRYGQSFDNSAVYDQQAAAHFLLYEPRFFNRLNNDVIGAAFNWAQTPIPGTRSEYHFEVFYRFPIFPNVDTSFSYQYIIDPALTREIDDASVFSFRIRSAF